MQVIFGPAPQVFGEFRCGKTQLCMVPMDHRNDLRRCPELGVPPWRIVTLWLFNIAMENGPFIDGLPIKNGDFP